MDPARLTPHLSQFCRARYGAGPCPVVQVAQTARRETHSGLVARLKDTEPRGPERQEENRAARARRMERQQRRADYDGNSQRDQSEPQALPLAARADVGRHGFGKYSAGIGLPGRSACQYTVTTHQRVPSK